MTSKIKIEYDAGTIVRAIRDLDQKIADTKEALKVLRDAREEQIELLLATIEDPQRKLPGIGGGNEEDSDA